MEVLFSFVAGALVELGKCVCLCVKNNTKFRSNLESLKTELDTLKNQRVDVKAKVEQAENDGRHERTAEVTKWLDQVDDTKVNSIESKMEEANKKRNQFKLLCCLGTTEMTDLLTQVKQLTKDGNSLLSGRLVIENNRPIRVEHIPGPSIENQSTASKNLSKVFSLLNDDKVRRIGVWGMGGVGKTTLVQNLNNMLKNSSSTTTTPPFSIVIWVTVSQNVDLKGVQTQIAERLKLDVSKNGSHVTSQIYNTLKERNFLLILDDVWKRIDLESLGIPQHNYSGKVIITSRSLDVCSRGMETDENVRVEILSDEESWELFTSKAGKVATLTHIEPLAKQITRECHGLPLAITIVGASMRKKEKIELWRDALTSLRRPTAPLNLITGIEDDVYKPLRYSYDSLPGMDFKYCFLYCCLYPEDFFIVVNELVDSWLVEGFIDELENYEAFYNKGIALVEYLKDSCLLEESKFRRRNCVKMHDVVRDVAIRIAEAELGFLVQSGIGLIHIPLDKLSESLKRVSFMSNRITSLPDCAAIPFPHISTLLLPHNPLSGNVAEGFLLGFPALKFLNLSNTDIQTLPRTLLKCSELQALFLESCHSLVEIPSLRGLINLKMINLSSTRIKELPEGMETLSNLRQLFLTHTQGLRKIRAGIISQLYSLEVLDMAGNTYEWAVRVEEGKASFEELGCLTKLSVLNIRLDVSCLSIDPPCWLLELKKFHFFVGNNAFPESLERKIDERRATLHLNNFSDTWSSGPLKCATSMTLICSHGFERKPENFCFNDLRSLRITTTNLFKGENKGNLVASRYDLLPNLEELFLYQVEGISSISDLAAHFGLRLKKLRAIGVEFCHDLKYVFSVGGSGLTLESLEEVTVRHCENVVDLFRCESSSQTSAFVDTSVLNLKIVDCGDFKDWRPYHRNHMFRGID